MKICVFGDSISWGADDCINGGWCDQLKNYLGELSDDTVYNLGVCGDTSKEILARFENEFKARKGEKLYFAIGINDSGCVDTPENPWIDEEQFAQNIQEIIDKAKHLTDEEIIFIGPTNVDETKTNPIKYSRLHYYTNDRIVKFDSTIKEICQKEKTKFISLLDLITVDDTDDGLHPNTVGHEKIFERIKENVSGLIVNDNI